MPKPAVSEVGAAYKQAAMNKIKEAIAPRDLFVRIYGRDPDRGELQQFRNRLNPNRSNLSMDMLGICIENIPELQNVTLAELFGLKGAKD